MLRPATDQTPHFGNWIVLNQTHFCGMLFACLPSGHFIVLNTCFFLTENSETLESFQRAESKLNKTQSS